MSTISPLPLASAILAALGPGYTQAFEPARREDDPPSINLRVRTPEGAELVIQATGYGHPRHFRIHGDYVFSKVHGTFYPANAPVIQVAATKTAEKIVQDLRRRFLPDFLAAWDESRTRAQVAEDAYAGKVKTYQSLCLALGETPKDPIFFHNGEFVIYRHASAGGFSVTARVSSVDSVRFDVSTGAEAGISLGLVLARLPAAASDQG